MPDQLSLPHSREAEEAVLGSVLIDSDCFTDIAQCLRADDFYIVRNRWIWAVFCQLSEQNRPIDYLTVSQELEQQNRLNEVGGPAYLLTLVSQTPTSLNSEAYAHLVAESGQRRRILQAANQVARLAVEKQLPMQEVLAQAEQILFEVHSQQPAHSISPLSEIVSSIYDQVQAAAQAKKELPGLPSGFQNLDALLQGLQDGNLLILAGRPGMGKTSLALSVVMNIVKQTRKPAAIFSLEMSKTEVGLRLLSQCSGIDGQRLRSGHLREEEYYLFIDAVEVLSALPILVDDTPTLTPAQLRARCRQIKARMGLDLVIVDYLQLMSGERRFENRQVEVSAISRQLKALAKELNIPVLAAAQLSRAVEQRGEKRPQLSDLRDSGSIEQDADVVMFLFKDEMKSGSMILEVAKHRSGPTGILPLTFHAQHTKFEDPAKR